LHGQHLGEHSPIEAIFPESSSSEPEGDLSDIRDSMTAVAINVRRIFILLLFWVVLIAIMDAYALLLQAMRFDYEGMRGAAVSVSIVIAVLATVTVYVAVRRKRITSL